MSVSPALMVPVLAVETLDGPGMRRPAPTMSVSGTNSFGTTGDDQRSSSQPNRAEDEVKVQWEPPGEIAVYKFLNQEGSVVLQVPPQPVLDLALAISQELEQEAAARTPALEGGKENGH